MTLQDQATRQFGATLTRMQNDIDNLKRGQRATQLGLSSLEDGAIGVYANGSYAGSFGIQPDGGFATVAAPPLIPPDRPNTPDLTPIASGINVGWNGTFTTGTGARPSNFKYCEIYRLSTADGISGSSNFIGTVDQNDTFTDAPLDSGSVYWYVFVAVNDGDPENGTGVRPTSSAQSLAASAQPEMVVAQAILDGIVTDVALADQAVTQSKIKLAAVGTGQIAGQAVTLSNMANGSVDARTLVDNAVTTPKLVNDVITAPKIAPLAVTTPAINPLAITTPTINTAAVTTPVIAPLAVTSPTIAASAITAPKIQASAVTTDALAANSIVAGKIAANTITANEIAVNAITADELAANSVTAGKVVADSITANEIATGAVTADAIQANAVTATAINAGSISTNKLAAGAVTTNELAANSVTAGKVVANSITANEIATNAITSLEINAGAVTAGKVAADAITANEIAAGAITANEISAGAVTAGKVSAGAIGANELAANSVIAGKIAADAVTANELAANSVLAENIVAGSIQTSKIAAGAVTATQVAALTLTSNELATNSITAGKITAGSITAPKLETNMVIANRIIAGSATGNRVEMHPTLGLQAYKSGGSTRSFWINSATGEAFFSGEIETAAGGNRIVINPGGTNPDEMRFYQGVNYGYINAEAAPGGTAAIVLRSQVVSSRLGSVGCYPAEAFIAYQPSSGTSLSAFSAVNGSANVWSNGNISLDVRNSSGRVDFTHADGGNARIEYRSTGAAEPQFFAPNRNIALTWVGGTFGLYVGNDAGQGQPITASSFPQASSRTIKKLERILSLKNASSSRSALSRVTPKMFNYDWEWAEGEARPAPKTFIRERIIENLFGEKVTEDFLITEEPPAAPNKPHIGLIAEDLRQVVPELVQEAPHIPGGYLIDTASVLGFLWQVNKDQEVELVDLRRDVNLLKLRMAQL